MTLRWPPRPLTPVALAGLAALSACAPTGSGAVSTPPAAATAETAPAAKPELDAQIRQLMADADIVGMAVAVIEDGEITHVNAYGYRNREQRMPLETDTIMYGASLTKAAFSYMIMQLVDEGLVDLDRPVADYLDKPLPAYPDYASLEGDEEWRLVTPRMVLTHTTGLANLRFFEPNQDLRFHFTPGTAYAYSGEGFWILQLMLEEGLGLDVKAEMQRRIFDRFDMPNTSMQWREDFADNLADGYAMDGSFEPHDERSNVSAAGSMDTSIADQARMWRGMLAGEGLSAESRAGPATSRFARKNATAAW
ncbi:MULTISPECIES: serine hydrolase domain-containing protein [Pacificimonas]|uniref:Beta-lactamase family protein n=1 Tax=Pacificimonas aurantium TaxID=1250540 RepID=A0ABS7WHW5_9SPHN|nr:MULTISPECIES: serine hydrolase domain-containing protein [Pacificimonas]MBZ6377554.1 beta-lactamase family protein [Pacificimonas aurantium]